MPQEIFQEPLVDRPNPHDGFYLISNSSSSKLISLGHRNASNNFSPAGIIDHPSAYPPISRPNNQAGVVISKIEDILHQMVDSIIDEKELVIHLKSRKGSGAETLLDTASGAIKNSAKKEARAIRFPGKTAQEAWRFTALLRILELSHEALVTGVVTTKRDMYYRDPELFMKQEVVDRYVDDIAYTLGVKRDTLNVVASAKGLVAGHLTIFKSDGMSVDCRVEKEGILIPSTNDIDHVDIRKARWILVVEKEATFRTLVTNRFWDTSPAGKGILITGKGYPDILTRAFVRLLSSQYRLTPSLPDSCFVKTFALMDFDPDGLAILSTYKHGSVSLAHENDSLVAPQLRWLGIASDVIRDLHRDKRQSWLRLTDRDRRLAKLMLEKPVFQEDEGAWRRELQVMLMLNIKAEIQILGDCSSLEEYLSSELRSYIFFTLRA